MWIRFFTGRIIPFPPNKLVKSSEMMSQILTIALKLISLNISEKRSIKGVIMTYLVDEMGKAKELLRKMCDSSEGRLEKARQRLEQVQESAMINERVVDEIFDELMMFPAEGRLAP
jgi:hypothetical protein